MTSRSSLYTGHNTTEVQSHYIEQIFLCQVEIRKKLGAEIKEFGGLLAGIYPIR